MNKIKTILTLAILIVCCLFVNLSYATDMIDENDLSIDDVLKNIDG